MARLRLFGEARQRAGTGADHVEGHSVDEVIAAAVLRYGDAFAEVLPVCRIWVNGEPASGTTPIGEHDEIAVLPPVSGG